MRIFTFALLITVPLTCQSTFAQQAKQIGPSPGTDPGPVGAAPGQAFVGNWEWSAGGEIFRITLIRNPSYTSSRNPAAGTKNVVTGQYSYMRNGVVVDQSTNTGPEPDALFCAPRNNTSMRMYFYDHARSKYGWAILSFVPGNANQLTWQLQGKEVIHIYPDVASQAGFTVPTSVTLTRVP